jgi:type I restriction enzyme, S subunit
LSGDLKYESLEKVAEGVTVGYVGPSSEYFCDDGVLFLRTGNVARGKLLLSNLKRVRPEFHSRQKKSALKSGDVVVSRVISDEINAAAIPPELNGANCGNIIVIRPGVRLEPRYLVHLISSPTSQRELLGRQVGSAQAVVNTRVLKTWQIPVISIEKQRRIAEVLDRAEGLRAKRRAALPQLDTLTQSIFLDLFGDPAMNPKAWPTKALASLVRDNDSINYGVVQPGDDFAEGVPLIRVGDLLEGEVNHSSLKLIAPSIEASYKRSRLRGNEVLVSCVGSIGVVALADQSVQGFNIARAVARIPLADNINRVFMASYLKTDFVQHYFTNELRTVSQPTLNIKQLSETPVRYPPLPLQNEFERNVAAINKLRQACCSSLAEMDSLFAALEKRAFLGEL